MERRRVKIHREQRHASDTLEMDSWGDPVPLRILGSVLHKVCADES